MNAKAQPLLDVDLLDHALGEMLLALAVTIGQEAATAYLPGLRRTRSVTISLRERGAAGIVTVPASRLDYMTKSVGVHEAKTHLSRLLEQVAAGEEIVITRRGREVARLVAFTRPDARRFGLDRDRLVVPDDFDAPLPDDVIAAFER